MKYGLGLFLILVCIKCLKSDGIIKIRLSAKAEPNTEADSELGEGSRLEEGLRLGEGLEIGGIERLVRGFSW